MIIEISTGILDSTDGPLAQNLSKMKAAGFDEQRMCEVASCLVFMREAQDLLSPVSHLSADHGVVPMADFSVHLVEIIAATYQQLVLADNDCGSDFATCFNGNDIAQNVDRAKRGRDQVRADFDSKRRKATATH